MILTHLPKSSGFYWWRESSRELWRMVQIINNSAGLSCLPKMLNAYDVEYHDWNGRSLARWEGNYPIGEWMKIEKPQATPSDEAIRPGIKLDSYAGGKAAHVTWEEESE